MSLFIAATIVGVAAGTQAAAEPSNAIGIYGTPLPVVWAGDRYEFRPFVWKASASAFRVGAINLPRWARLAADGTLSGTPAVADSGVYSNISIVVSDESGYAIFGPFQVNVKNPNTARRLTVAWQAPFENEDGSPLTDLTGYRVLVAPAGQPFAERARITDPASRSVVVDRLEPGMYFVQVIAINRSGLESRPTSMVWTTLR